MINTPQKSILLTGNHTEHLPNLMCRNNTHYLRKKTYNIFLSLFVKEKIVFSKHNKHRL